MFPGVLGVPAYGMNVTRYELSERFKQGMLECVTHAGLMGRKTLFLACHRIFFVENKQGLAGSIEMS